MLYLLGKSPTAFRAKVQVQIGAFTGMMGLTKQRWVPVQPTATDSDSEDEGKTEAEMMAKHETTIYCGWQGEGKPGSTRRVHHRIIHTLRILTTDRDSTME